LNGTRLPEKVGLLAKVLVETVALTSVQNLISLGYDWLTPIIGQHGLHDDFSLRCVPMVLEGYAHSRSNGHRYGTLLGVPLRMEEVSPDWHP
jgi:hypothetical protein